MIQVTLDGQVAVVSGGSRGIGAAIVKLLAQAGAKITFSYHSNAAAAKDVVQACNGGSDSVQAIVSDAGEVGHGDALVHAAVRQFGRVDIAVANAGIWNVDDIPLEELTPTAWDETVNCNLRGVYSLARAALIQMKRQPRLGGAAADAPRGRIVAIASTAGQRGEAWHTHYGAAKAGVIGFVRGLGPEVARDGVRVNCVAPGWVQTDMAAPAIEAHPERVFGAIPLGRPGKAEEIAGCVLFLCTPWSDFLTASVISANGGAVLA